MASALLYTLAATLAVSLVSFVGVMSLPRQPRRGVTLVLVALAVGALLGDSLFHLLPEAFEEAGPTATPLLILGGLMLFYVVEKVLCHVHRHDEDSPARHDNFSVGKVNLLADALHNLLDGVIIGAAFLVSPAAGIATTIAVALHEIPQELGDAGVLTMAGYTRRQVGLFNFLSACFAILGGVAVISLGDLVLNHAPWVGAATAGGFIYLALADLMPELHREHRAKRSALHLVVLLAGLALMAGLTLLE